MHSTADVAVIGAGIIGLAIADALLELSPGCRVVVLDKEPRLGTHASGRNSGVLHAGFYYTPDSLKARLTKDGNRLLRLFCQEERIPFRANGKLVVTRHESELPRLDALLRRAAVNGIDVQGVDEAQARELEPLARTVERALWSPTTASASPHAVLDALANRVRRRGGEVLLNAAVTTARGSILVSRAGSFDVGHVVNAAGLHADRVAQWFDLCPDYVVLPFKGLYWYGDWPPGRLRRHVYPVPDPREPFLGVHVTADVNGAVKIGPTAIPALWREDYGRLRGFAAADMIETAGSLPQFLRSPRHDAVALLRKELPKYWRRRLVAEARRLVPDIHERNFRLRAPTGVRAQLFHTPSRTLEMDFVVRSDDRSTHVLNAVSPAWTSSLAVGQHVAGIVLGRP